ncbi:hypothetical protein GW17_00043569 [Ensete ventricosum]|nr:hypothetical protein GW17_00043569 [Ensete ventricosum]RZR99287.1 hypothetical protein BHM03_00028802 [Ensete ventricosum]
MGTAREEVRKRAMCVAVSLRQTGQPHGPLLPCNILRFATPSFGSSLAGQPPSSPQPPRVAVSWSFAKDLQTSLPEVPIWTER